VPDPYSFVKAKGADDEDAPVTTGWGALPAPSGFSMFSSLPAETKKKSETEKRGLSDPVDKEGDAKRKKVEEEPKAPADVAGAIRKCLRALKKEDLPIGQYAPACGVLVKIVKEQATNEVDGLLVSCLASAIGKNGSFLDCSDHIGPLMGLLEASAERGAELFSPKAIYQIGLWRVQAISNLMEAETNDLTFGKLCCQAKTQFESWAADKAGPASSDARWAEVARLCLEAAYARAEMRYTEAIKDIQALFELATTTVMPRFKASEVLYRNEVKEMATTVKACKYDPSKLVLPVSLGALDSQRKGPLYREISDGLDQLEEFESF